MDTNTQTAQPNTAYNGGQPLTPKQIQDMRTTMGITQTSGNSTPSASTDVGSQWAKFDQQFSTGNEQPQNSEQASEKQGPSLDNAVQKAGEDAQNESYVGGLGDRTAEQIGQGLQTAKKGFDAADTAFQESGKDVQSGDYLGAAGNYLKGVGGGTAAAVAGGFQTAFAPITALVSPAIKPLQNIAETTLRTQHPVLASIYDKLAPDIQQKITNTMGKLDTKYPDAKPIVANVLNSILGFVGAGEVKGAAGDALNTTLEGSSDGFANIKEPTTKSMTFEQSIKDAQKVLNPESKYTPQEKSEMLGSETKTKGKGILKRDVIEQKANPEHEAVSELINNGEVSTKNTPGENVQAIQRNANRVAQSNDEYLNTQGKDVLVNGKDTAKVFDSVLEKAKQDRVFLSDSSEEKAYNDVIDVAREEINKNKGNIPGLRQGIKSFNSRMESILGKDIYTEGGSPTTIGKARIQAAKDVRYGLNDFIQNSLNDAHVTRVSEMTPSMRDIFKEAQNGKYKSFDEFESAMKDQYSAKLAEEKFAQKTGTPNKGTEKSIPHQNGLSLTDRGGAMEGKMRPEIHGKGYTTTPEEDLREVWDMAHESVASTKGDVFKSSLQREARLRSAADELKYRAGDTIGTSKASRILSSKEGKNIKRALQLLGWGVGVGATGEILIHKLGSE